MVGNQARVNHLTRESTAQVSLSRDLQQAALDARIKLNELISIDRDLRLARTSADVNFVLQQMASRAADANQAYDGAVTIAAKDEDKQLLKRAKAAFNDYVATAQEIARLQHEIIGMRDQQLADAAAWSEGVRYADQRRGDRHLRQPSCAGKQSPAGQLGVHARSLVVVEPLRAERQHAGEPHFRCARHDDPAARGVARHDAPSG